MDHSARRLAPARIVALGVIALLAAGLVALRFAADDQPVGVPAGAQAGDLEP
jgi:hypothetical protein